MAMRPDLRSFQWCKTPEKFEGAHTTPDGWSVGIYIGESTQAARVGLGMKDAEGKDIDVPPNVIPEHVQIVRPDGTNLMKMNESGDALVPVTADLAQVEILLDHDHIPECRQNPLWKGKQHYTVAQPTAARPVDKPQAK